jgi:hypothetical protein
MGRHYRIERGIRETVLQNQRLRSFKAPLKHLRVLTWRWAKTKSVK